MQALRAAGAIVLGKTVTTELGMSHPGPTTNPFSAVHTPGGSSSGSAAVIGARMVPAAIGTQVVGSVIRPASFCANYAIKPTMGALNRGERQGFSQSHLGVHAGCLADMWHVAIEIAKRSGGDPGYPGLYGGEDLHGPERPRRLVVMEAQGWVELDQQTKNAFEDLLSDLERAGVQIIRRSDHALVERFEQSIGDSLELTRDVCAYEMRWSLENLVEQFGGGLSDSLTSRLDIARRMTLDDYRLVLAKRDAARAAHASIAHIADAIIAPSSIGPAPRLDNQGVDSGVVHTTGLPNYNAVTSLLGAPTITLPLLAVGGLTGWRSDRGAAAHRRSSRRHCTLDRADDRSRAPSDRRLRARRRSSGEAASDAGSQAVAVRSWAGCRFLERLQAAATKTAVCERGLPVLCCKPSHAVLSNRK